MRNHFKMEAWLEKYSKGRSFTSFSPSTVVARRKMKQENRGEREVTEEEEDDGEEEIGESKG